MKREHLTDFKEFMREAQPYRDAECRSTDFQEIYGEINPRKLHTQSARCMDCGIPFCQSSYGCPVENLIPEWNELVHQDNWRAALNRLHMTNNFPEFTGRVCPAPCEGACVLGLTHESVTIKNIEYAIADRGFAEDWIKPNPPQRRTGKKIAVIGSGPAGLAAAAQLNKTGHNVTVYERADRVGGLLMYGIPNMKLDKSVVERRVNILALEGIKFITGADVGGKQKHAISIRSLLETNDAVLLATGATRPRDLALQQRDLKGIHYAMDYLTASTKKLFAVNNSSEPVISAQHKSVIVIGGGDTGADCIGTALRQGANTVINFELLPMPPPHRAADNPWPEWPKVFRVDYAHEEAITKCGRDAREYCVLTKAFVGDTDGNLVGIKTVDVAWSQVDIQNDGQNFGRPQMHEIKHSERFWSVDLVLLAMGFLGPEDYVTQELDITLDERSNFKAPYGKFSTNITGIFAAGDCRRGQSLVVWAINEGRGAAREIDRYLMGATLLP